MLVTRSGALAGFRTLDVLISPPSFSALEKGNSSPTIMIVWSRPGSGRVPRPMSERAVYAQGADLDALDTIVAQQRPRHTLELGRAAISPT